MAFTRPSTAIGLGADRSTPVAPFDLDELWEEFIDASASIVNPVTEQVHRATIPPFPIM